MLASIRGKFVDQLFEFRHHAYIEMAWYFGMCLFLNVALGVWGGINVDRDATAGLASTQMRVTCGEINSFLVVYSTFCFADAIINFFLVIALPSIMRGPRWAGCGLFNLFAYLLASIAKVIGCMLGAIYILSQDGKQCKPLLPRFYSHAYTYFLVVVIVLGLQFTAGFLYLWKFGLQDAVDEGAEQIRQEALGRQARQEREALIEDPRNV